MKKFFTAIFSAFMILLLTACGSSNAAQMDTQSKTLVVFFSANGHTAELAKNLSATIGANLFEITPKVEYTSADLDWHNEKSRSSVEMKDEKARPEITGKIENFDSYNTIILAYPIWWDIEPRIVDTFLESYNFTGKTIVPICTSGGSGIENSQSHVQKICPAATWKNGKRFSASTSKDDLKKWYDKL